MRALPLAAVLIAVALWAVGCDTPPKNAEPSMSEATPTAADLLSDPVSYPAISYGGYRATSRDTQPTVAQLQQDMRILHAMGVRMLRTYNVHLPHATNVLTAIREIKLEDPDFEMYVMLGSWIDCKYAWTDREPDHDQESERNAAEIGKAVALAREYPDIVKIIAVGNEAMVKWATSYYVQPWVILKWVNHLQELKRKGELDPDLWITSSDNFASWGGGGEEYHVDDLNKLIAAVDYVSMHTYPMHDTHYNPAFWGVAPDEDQLPKVKQIERAMARARDYAMEQYRSVVAYLDSLGIDKPIHIGETGWASSSNGFYGPDGSLATDEFKQALYYDHMREWSAREGISCFYFEAFDEPWKDAGNPGGSENYFGLINRRGQAKYALWPLVRAGAFEGLQRDGKTITMTYSGDREALLEAVESPKQLSR